MTLMHGEFNSHAEKSSLMRLSFAFRASIVHASVVDVVAGQSLGEIATSRDAVLAINAGYFDAAFEPLGLLRIDGVDRGTLLRQPPLSGLVLIDARGTLTLVPRDDPSLVSAASAFQAGPFLIDPGGAIGIARSDGPSAERTVIATTDRDVVVIVTSPVTLRDLAECLHDCRAIADGPIDSALNLDGGPSTGFAFREAGTVTASAPRGLIRSALFFAARR